MTDAAGKFTIKVPAEATLYVDFLGYENLTVPVQGRAVIEIQMDPEYVDLEETLVVAYGTSTKSSFTGSAAMVNSKTIESRINNSVTSALSGNTAGVQVLSSSGDPASNGATIRIRGIGSMSAETSPLIILDGMTYDGSISDINPNDVESMSVLKDAAANAIYGARGANGVILITTKKGAGNKPNVKFDAKWGSNSRLIPQYDVISDPGQYYETIFTAMYNKNYYAGKTESEAYNEACKNLLDQNNGGVGYLVYTIPQGENLIGTNLKLNPNAQLGYSDGEYYYTPDNWYDETFHNSFRQEYNLSVSGSKEKLSYFGSVGYLDDGGIVKNSNYKRFTGRVNVDYQAKKWLKVSTNMSYSHSDSQQPSYDSGYGSSGNVFYVTNTIGPIYPLYVRDKNGNIMTEDGRIMYDSGKNTNQSRSNMQGNAVRDNDYNKRQNYADVFNGKAGIVITPVKGFDITGNIGLFNDNTRYNELVSKFASAKSEDGIAYVYHSRKFAYNAQALASYKTDFNGSNHHFDILAGYERYQLKDQFLSGQNDHLFNPFIGELGNAKGKSSMQTDSYTDNYMTQGFLARVQYDYAGKYFISGSYRRDASSRFASGHQWGNFGSVGLAWLISGENFMAGAKWVNMLKLKASYGLQGNDKIGGTNKGGYYPYADQYSTTYNESTGEYSMTLVYKGNEELTWESSHSFNIGVDFELFGGYLNGSLEFFDKETSDLLYSRDVPASSGNPTGKIPVNVGSIQNLGGEFTFNGFIFNKKNFRWDWNLNLTTYKNTIKSLDSSVGEEGLPSSGYIYRVGGSLYQAYMRQFAGLSEDGEALYWMDELNEAGEKTGNRVTTNDPTSATQYDLGSVLPKAYGGFGMGWQFYGVDISAQFSYQLGGRYYDGAYQSMMFTSGLSSASGNNLHKDLLNAWTPENRNTDIPRLDGNSLLSQLSCDRFLVSSDYLALNNAQIGYTFPKKWMQKIRLGSLRVYVAGENLFVLTARKGIDPRYSMGLGTMTSGSGLNTGAYSAMRNVTGGITLTF